MANPTITRIYDDVVSDLPLDEQAELMETIRERLEQLRSESKVKWRDIRGAAPYPMMGEDAQEWVSRTRREERLIA